MPEEIHSLSESLDRINRAFQDIFHRMDFFFCYKDQKVRTIFNVIRSLPNLYLRVENDETRTLIFESTWANVNNSTTSTARNRNVGLVGAGRAIPRRPPEKYFAHSFMSIPLTHQVNVFEYGFELLSESGIDMIAIKSDCLQDQSIGYIRDLVGQTYWAVPPVREGTPVELVCYWRLHVDDDFDQYIRQKQRGVAVRSNRRNLIIEDCL